MSSVAQVQTNAFNSITKKTTEDNLDKDQFLKLLITQMKYQDPLEPMKNEAFIAQLAQFSSLESMKNMEKELTGTQAYTLIGKTVTSIDQATLASTSGLVSGVKLQDGKYSVVIKDLVNKTLDKSAAQQAFAATQIPFDTFKSKLFTEDSLKTDKLSWKSEINSLDSFAKALGYSNADYLPSQLSRLWNTENYVEIPVEKISYVF